MQKDHRCSDMMGYKDVISCQAGCTSIILHMSCHFLFPEDQLKMEYLCFPPQPGSVPLDNQFNVFKLPELGNVSQSDPFGPMDDLALLVPPPRQAKPSSPLPPQKRWAVQRPSIGLCLCSTLWFLVRFRTSRNCVNLQ